MGNREKSVCPGGSIWCPCCECRHSVARSYTDHLLSRRAAIPKYRSEQVCEKAFLTLHDDNYAEYPEAYTNFHKAIKLDSHFVRPYVGLLELLLREGNPDVNAEPDELRKTTGKLITLAPHLAATYCARSILCYEDWDFPAATRYAFQATKANPEYELGHTWYGYVLEMTGWPIEARAQLEASLALAPPKPLFSAVLG